MAGALSKPAAILAETLSSPGTLNSVILFTVVAVAELLLNESIFVCPCTTNLAIAYGMSFLLVPALLLFLADVPWKLIRGCPSPTIFCSLLRRPLGLAVTWIIIGFLQRRYVNCIIGKSDQEGCEKSVKSTWLQLMALYIWIVIVVCTLVLVLCRRVRASCIKGSSAALELRVRFQMEEKQKTMDMEKKVKYGVTDTKEGDVSLEHLRQKQPGLTPQTYDVLRSEQLLKPSVLPGLRPEDLLSLDISVAQRCLLRQLLETTKQKPNLWTASTCTTGSGVTVEKKPAKLHFEREKE